ncbi:WD40 repeat-like protein [Coemansia reversa NRRL 1564]|uniref:WD40 repeat-like protein n=1 Tax=Coemansia reversa (strain ATCC 12441 / NRRL 1564) TaxID=763665 RepID=A0A2G5BAQ1_COERN|nr:WD40 repeat-like protein [Coemansia reversa NRRL 1564]|eukprot:PIA16080.1 WD40 repeat-like protein [Coemansia reversa NRRL 1564]
MALSDELNKYIPKGFGKKKNKKGVVTGNTDSKVDVAQYNVSVAKKNTKDKHNYSTPEVGRSVGTITTNNTINGNLGDKKSETTDVGEEDTSGGAVEIGVPVSYHVAMTGHKKAVSTIAWDPSGDGLASGEHGANMMLWSFPSMDRSFQSYRTVVPFEGQQIHALKYNSTGDLLLCATGDPRPTLFMPDGRKVCEFKRGDMYVMDMRRTTGHVAALTSVDWCPEGGKFVTAGADSTLRIWDCERPQTQLQVIVAKTQMRGRRVAVTACAYSADGRTIASTQDDGGLSLWPSSGPFIRPTQHTNDAHLSGTETSAVQFIPGNSNHLVTRGGDSTVKLWDVRNLKTSLATKDSLPSAGPEANMAFDSDGRYLLVGAASAGSTPSQNASIAVLDSSDLTEKHQISLPLSGDVLSVTWHPRLNQIAAGLTTGTIAVMYDASSTRGAKLCISKRLQARQTSEPTSIGPIITPHALPLFREEKSMMAKRRREKAREDPLFSQKPKVPIYGHGKGGVIGVNETQHIMKSIMKDTVRDDDPREALLRYAAVAESDPMFISPSYKDTQDKPLFDDTGMSEEPEMKRRK